MKYIFKKDPQTAEKDTGLVFELYKSWILWKVWQKKDFALCGL